MSRNTGPNHSTGKPLTVSGIGRSTKRALFGASVGKNGTAARSGSDLLRQAEAELGFVGLYVIGPKCGYPVVFGIAGDPANAWRALKRGHWDLHEVHAFCWTPGRPTAERLKAKLTERLAEFAQFENAEWYNLSTAEIISHIEVVAQAERIELFDEVERQRRFERRARAFLDAKVAPFQRKPSLLHLVKG